MRHVSAYHAALLLIIIAAVVGCKSAPASEDRSPGEIAFRRNCQSCHILPRPGMKTDEEWPALVARYGKRAKLNQEQIAQITEYLISAN